MNLEWILLTVLVVFVGLLVLGQLVKVPYPVLMVVGGLAIGLVPGMPTIELKPEIVLVGILPPLLYGASFFTPLRELRDNIKPISVLAVGLVLATMVVVACVAHAALDFGWAESFVLGAVVSPTDPVAATAIAQRVGIPTRIVSIVEGESLINDATALVALRFAVIAVVTGSFSLFDASLSFVLNAAGGVAVGITVGWVIAHIRRKLDDPPVEITIAFASGYFAFLPAAAIGVSGVVAAVTVGIYMGRLTSQLTNATTRIQGFAFWEIVTFVLNASLFALVGMQLPSVVQGLNSSEVGQLVLDGALITAVVIVTRIVWVFPFTYGPRALFHSIRAREPDPPLKHTTIVAWSGMRGAVSLAAALAIPLSIDGGGAFPHRGTIIFLTFCVLLGTLLIQGLTLAPLVRLLGVEEDDRFEYEEANARVRVAEAAISGLDVLIEEEWARDETVERMRGLYEYRSRRFRSRVAEDGYDDEVDYEARSADYQRLTHAVIEVQRRELQELRDSRFINDAVARRIERDLDLEEARLEL